MKRISDRVRKILGGVRKREFQFDKEARVRFFTDAEDEKQAERDFQEALKSAATLAHLMIDVDSTYPEGGR